MKADPCLACMSLNLRADDAPIPTACPTCGRATLLVPPAPSRLDRLRAEVRRRVFVDGDEGAV